jgi:hypothetical protein
MGPILIARQKTDVDQFKFVSYKAICIYGEETHKRRRFFGILASPDVELEDIWNDDGSRLLAENHGE